ncbi:hypothetical protein [Dokdonella sp.]|uniref:hypothetical protein n=1 Tax=Dokdonella sp. TaxID=2291710 RepID=UPI003C49070A
MDVVSIIRLTSIGDARKRQQIDYIADAVQHYTSFLQGKSQNGRRNWNLTGL